MTTITNAVPAAAQVGECPLWDARDQVLYWVDIDGQLIHKYNPSSGVNETKQTSGRPGSFVLTSTPGLLLVAMEHQLVWFQWENGTETPWQDLEQNGTGNRLNDGRCDPAGRFVVGSMYADTSAGKRTGMLHQVESDGNHRLLRTGIGVSNGLAFDHERGRMYFADTRSEIVWVWDYNLETGNRTNGRVFIDYTQLPGKPDGGCVDTTGCYWSASIYASALLRVTPEGTTDQRLELPVPRPTMPAFGGNDLSTLFVTTIGAPTSKDIPPDSSGFASGDLLAVDCGVQGMPEPVFTGPGPATTGPARTTP